MRDHRQDNFHFSRSKLIPLDPDVCVRVESKTGKALRVGLLIDRWDLPSWIGSIASDITASESADIVAVVLNETEESRKARIYDHPRPNPFCLAELYFYLDYRVFRPLPDALQKVDLKTCLKEYSIIEGNFLFNGLRFSFNERDQKLLRELDLDVLLLFCSGLPADPVLPLARYGVWCFLHQELLSTGHSPVGFWEVLSQRPVTMQCLLAHVTGSSLPLILHRHYGPTDLRSITKCRNNLFWKSAPFVKRKLDELHRLGSLKAIGSLPPGPSENSFGKMPSNLRMLKPIAAHALRFAYDRMADRRYFTQWSVGYKFTICDRLVDRDFADYQWLLPPTDRYWADPFPVKIGESYFLFFEEFLYAEKKGHLSVAALDQDGFKEEPKIVLEHKYHLSYPFIFFWKGEWFLIPEAQETNRIDVYKFDVFPYQLSYCKTLMENVRAADTTLVEVDGRWWMFVAIASHKTWNVDELFLFCAHDPFGPWLPHPRNPISSDVRCARSAGQILKWQEGYYRPAQDCSRDYGYAVRLQRIKVLSDTNYVEEEAEMIPPNWSPDIAGIHTFNTAGDLTVIDVKRNWPRKTKNRSKW